LLQTNDNNNNPVDVERIFLKLPSNKELRGKWRSLSPRTFSPLRRKKTKKIKII